ncbi:MAG: DUF1249 domain-containing protein [Pseudomonadota bacterium]
MRGKRYTVDLRSLHALCDANYARLLRLFPDYETSNGHQFSLPLAQVQIDVLERTRYTTLFRLRSYRPAHGEQSGSEQTQWLEPLNIEARAYHDASMLEVVNFQQGGRTEGRYDYPNAAMHQQDEKIQQNAFVAEWLSHCLHYGLHQGDGDLSAYLKPGATHA